MTRGRNFEAAAPHHRHCRLEPFGTQLQKAEERESSNYNGTDYRDGRVPAGDQICILCEISQWRVTEAAMSGIE
ncbi:uncharacterized protein N7479_000517 [Penicillium vulpinum]|uniref:uncharacterized protein n=1 Tax=Penicillium vulpinum TaxID=29845 RepID=UPI0025495AB3|nr:uncharacterized protein N7479_000517 [Penicillium vulpinum]KAJ5970599.1 hypothetical protein N7479_000517 [Penicillium vulpinum]